MLMSSALRRSMVAFIFASSAQVLMAADEKPSAAMIEALTPMSSFVGAWKGDGTSRSSAGWKESAEVTWGFRKSDGRASINFYPTGNPYFEAAILTFDLESKEYVFSAKKGDKRLSFRGPKDGEQGVKLLRENKEGADKLDRLTLRATRAGDKIVMQFGMKKGRMSFEDLATIELFREGKSEEDFVKGPRCPITGGSGRIEVSHEGASYFVACDKTKELFESDPATYAAAAKKKEEERSKKENGAGEDSPAEKADDEVDKKSDEPKAEKSTKKRGEL